MVKSRILKRQNKCYLELPDELLNYNEMEVFKLKDGYYLLSLPLDLPIQKPPQTITEGEKAVLKKLLAIRFEKRIPKEVDKLLSDQEKSTIKELEQKGFVNIYRGQKYVDGVYNIKDSIYPMLAQKAEEKTVAKTETAESPQPAVQKQAPKPVSSSPISMLHSRGFLILQDKREALAMSEQLSQEMKNGSVAGVKGFDGKFYVVTRNYLTKAQTAIASILKDGMDSASIASASKIDPEGCVAVLRLMAENGEIIEKKKGIFAPV